MSVVINSNLSALIASNNLAATNQQLNHTLGQLASGSRLVNSSDDAGGEGVALKLSAVASRESQISNNLADASSFAQTQDGALSVAGSILNRMSELVTLYTDPTKNTSDLANYNDEFTQLQSELTAIGAQTFNGTSLFGTKTLSVDATDDLSANGAIAVSQQDLTGSAAAGLTDDFSNLSNWSTSGTVSAAGHQLVISGSDVDSTAASNQSFSGPFEMDFQLFIPGSGDAFSVRHGTDALVDFSGGGNITRNTTHDVKIVLDSTGTANTYLDGSSTPVATHTGNSLTSSPVYLEDMGLGPAIVQNFSLTGTGSGANMANLLAASGLGAVSLSNITGALQSVATMRASNGAEQSRINFASSLLTTNQTNLEATVSRISDVDVAQATTTLARYQVLVQAGVSMLTQANQSSQVALKLITGG